MKHTVAHRLKQAIDASTPHHGWSVLEVLPHPAPAPAPAPAEPQEVTLLVIHDRTGETALLTETTDWQATLDRFRVRDELARDEAEEEA